LNRKYKCSFKDKFICSKIIYIKCIKEEYLNIKNLYEYYINYDKYFEENNVCYFCKDKRVINSIKIIHKLKLYISNRQLKYLRYWKINNEIDKIENVILESLI
jgi:hypothetical protein